jgi:hypothetical protein
MSVSAKIGVVINRIEVTKTQAMTLEDMKPPPEHKGGSRKAVILIYLRIGTLSEFVIFSS